MKRRACTQRGRGSEDVVVETIDSGSGAAKNAAKGSSDGPSAASSAIALAATEHVPDEADAEAALEHLMNRVRRLKERVAAGEMAPQVLLEFADAQEDLPRAWCRVIEARVQRLMKRVTSGDFAPSTLRALADAQEELTKRESVAANQAVEMIMLSLA